MPDAVAVPPAEQPRFLAPGSAITFVVDAEHTGGRCSIQRIDCDPHFSGPPAHIHHAMEEVFHVLDGEVSVQLGKETIVASAGTTITIPRETAHRYWNASDAPHSFLCICSPAGFEQYFVDMAAYVRAHGRPPDVETRRDLYAKYETSLLD